MSSENKLVVIFGGSGFIGRHVVQKLAKKGYRIRVACRRPDLAGHLQPLGVVGQIQAVQCNVRYPKTISQALKGADEVINLTGILFETGKQKFYALQAEAPKLIAEAAKNQGLKRIIHVSAIGADATSPSLYAQSKAFGEEGVLETLPESIIFRPSLVFGPEDGFFNLFGKLATFSPALPLIGGGKTLFQPVYVGDVAEAIVKAVEGKVKAHTYELGGAEKKSFKALLEQLLQVIRRKPLLVPLPFFAAYIQATFLQLLPKPLLTVDQVTLLKKDNVVSISAEQEQRTLEGLGITPTRLDAILPQYLWRYRPNGQFSTEETA